jgi:hypothetical protein
MRDVAEFIARDSGGRPFSVELVEPGNFPAHYHYLLTWLGRPPLNSGADYYHREVAREAMGERIYLIIGPGMDLVPALKGWAGPLPEPVPLNNLWLYRIESGTLPPGTRRLKLGMELRRPEWAIEVVK